MSNHRKALASLAVYTNMFGESFKAFDRPPIKYVKKKRDTNSIQKKKKRKATKLSR